MPLGLYRALPSGQILRANDALARILGARDREALRGRREPDLFAEANLPKTPSSDAALRRDPGDDSHDREIRIRRADDTEIWIRHRTWDVTNSLGQTLYREGSVEDVTLRRRQATDRAETLEALPDLVFRLSASGVLLEGRAPQGFAIEINPAPYLGLDIAVFLPPEICQLGKRAITLARETGEVQVYEVESDLGGERRSWETRVTPCGFHDVIALVREVTHRRRMEEQLRDLGIRDALTGLYNRAYFQAEIQRLQKSRKFPVSVVVIDLDDLKGINDRQGHAAGDELLRRTGHVLRAAFREEDAIARIGGDEFAVLLPQTDQAAAAAAIRRVREMLADSADDGPIPRLSAGLATGNRDSLLIELVKKADARMYQEKASKATGTRWSSQAQPPG